MMSFIEYTADDLMNKRIKDLAQTTGYVMIERVENLDMNGDDEIDPFVVVTLNGKATGQVGDLPARIVLPAACSSFSDGSVGPVRILLCAMDTRLTGGVHGGSPRRINFRTRGRQPNGTSVSHSPPSCSQPQVRSNTSSCRSGG
jgi:hypothetical protein